LDVSAVEYFLETLKVKVFRGKKLDAFWMLSF